MSTSSDSPPSSREFVLSSPSLPKTDSTTSIVNGLPPSCSEKEVTVADLVLDAPVSSQKIPLLYQEPICANVSLPSSPPLCTHTVCLKSPALDFFGVTKDFDPWSTVIFDDPWQHSIRPYSSMQNKKKVSVSSSRQSGDSAEEESATEASATVESSAASERSESASQQLSSLASAIPDLNFSFDVGRWVEIFKNFPPPRDEDLPKSAICGLPSSRAATTPSSDRQSEKEESTTSTPPSEPIPGTPRPPTPPHERKSPREPSVDRKSLTGTPDKEGAFSLKEEPGSIKETPLEQLEEETEVKAEGEDEEGAAKEEAAAPEEEEGAAPPAEDAPPAEEGVEATAPAEGAPEEEEAPAED